MKLSIIVPVYNVKKYLNECIDSILSQKYNDYELLIVDDGSTDGSSEICDEYGKNKQVKVFHKKNDGLSSARNYGINRATGQYVMFIDGDDYLLNENCLTILGDAIKNTHADVIQYRAIYFYEKAGKFKKQKNEICDNNTNDIFTKLLELNKQGTFSVSAWDKIVKRSVIKGNELFFEKGLLAEDIDWSLKLYPNIEKMAVLNEDLYVYRQQREGSITSKKDKKRIESLQYIIEKWSKYEYRDEQMRLLYLNFLAYQYIILLTLVDRCDIDKYLGFKNLLDYDDNYKVKLCNKIIKLIGLGNGVFIFKLYLRMKNKGLIRI